MAQAPTCLAMILCDSIARDPSTGKQTILGVFSSTSAEVYPSQIQAMTAFLELTNGHHEVELTLKFTRVTPDELDGDVVMSVSANVPFEDPRSVIQLNVGFTNVPLPQPGEYRLILEMAGGELITERRLVALPPAGAS